MKQLLMRGEAFTVAKSTQEEIDKLFQMKIDNSDKESDQNTAETNQRQSSSCLSPGPGYCSR